MKLSILKTLLISILLFIAPTELFTNTALSSPSPQSMGFIAQTPGIEPQIEKNQNPQPPETTNATVKNTSKNSETLNQQPTKEASPSGATAQRNPSESAGPYDMEMIKAFNRGLYGS
jgi:hypothetical protein